MTEADEAPEWFEPWMAGIWPQHFRRWGEPFLRDTPEASVREVHEPCRLTEQERAESARLLASVENLG